MRPARDAGSKIPPRDTGSGMPEEEALGMNQGTSGVRRWHLGSLLVLLVVVVVLWKTPLSYPLRILTVFFHESSHGAMALLTGGSIQDISVVKEEGGVCTTAGGNRFLILSAGYLGSLLWGGTILVLATRTRFDRALSAVLGAVLVLISLLWVRPPESFGFIFGLAAGVAMAAVGMYLPGAVNDYLLKVVGLTSCLSAILDLKDDVLDRPEAASDAAMLAEVTGLPTLFWGALWMAIAGAATIFFLLQVSRAREPVERVSRIAGPREPAGR